MSISIVSILTKKRDGKELSKNETDFFIKSVVNGTIGESQIGAMLMAIYINGMTFRETADLTRAMTYTGEVMYLPEWQHLLVDKHSTGGVGDNISLPLVPILMALGLKVPMMSGRGLEITGGTLDKLESIPGYRCNLSKEEMMNCLKSVGGFIASTTKDIAPADRILYQRRDVTRTVASLPLIVSSILSKKVAEGAKAVVMDIKVGNAAFMKTVEEAKKLADLMIKIGDLLDIKVRALISQMDRPLGSTCGDALEISTAIDCLRNKGPADTMTIVTTIASMLLTATGKAIDHCEAEKQINEVLINGKALKRFELMLRSQGVAENIAKELCSGDYEKVLNISKNSTLITAEKTGFISDIDAFKIGTVWWNLGGGRSKPTDHVNHSVGVRLLKNVGEKIGKNEAWAIVYHASEVLPEKLKNMMDSGIFITSEKPCVSPLIILQM